MAESAAPRHRAFERSPVVSLGQARLTDKGRLSVLLQGAALLTHLERAGWRLGAPPDDAGESSSARGDGWEGAGLTVDGTLCLLPPAPGRSALQAQEHLRCLVARLFGSTDIAGRGQARRALRGLLTEWWQGLLPLAPEKAVEQMLMAAPFLWERAYSRARLALVAELPAEEPGAWRISVAASSGIARRLERWIRSREDPGGQDAGLRGALEALLASDDARWAWAGSAPDTEAGARRTGPGKRRGDGEEIHNLVARGRFEEALVALGRQRSVEARLLRVRCQLALGRLGAAWNGIRRLQAAQDRGTREGKRPLSPEQVLELAEMAVRTLANQGRSAELGAWVSRARAEARRASDGPRAGYLQARFRLLAAVAAGDRGKSEERQVQLAACRDRALSDPRLAWPWLRAAAQSALDRGEPEEALTHLARALREHRRPLRGKALSRLEAAELWNEVGVCRARLGDLGGAEKAFAHTVRLFQLCEGPRKTTLALFNLAEIRIRRGRRAGTREILEQVTAENRAAGNLRAQVQDAELWARYELLLGRPHAARAHCDEARKLLARRGVRWRREVLAVLAARARGWIGDSDGAAGELEAGGRDALGELEPEERPALLALAGDRAAALDAASGTPLAALWTALLCAGDVPAGDWQALEQLGSYRAARTLFDAELVAPGSVPAPRRRWAAATLRRAGAVALGERLERRDAGAWETLSSYLGSPSRPRPGASAAGAGGSRPHLEPWKECIQALLAGIGYEGVALRWEPPSGSGNGALELISGNGSSTREVLRREVRDGVLTLHGPLGDSDHALPRREPVLEACLDLVAGDLESVLAGRPAGPARTSESEGPRRGRLDREASAGADSDSRFRIVGRSAELRTALERIDRLSPVRMPVLIVGESGTGKELAARRVHARGPSPRSPFVAFNCAAISESLLLSDLFGHARGAFTGADRDRAGLFETARDGTVFLDEIGDLPATAQGMLLRVLQENEVRRVGESLPRKVRARVVAATHRDLATLVESKKFRQDLFYRLKVAAITLPPLRERKEDIPLLAEYFLSRSADAFGGRLSSAAQRALVAHSWPGNIRELRNILQVASALAREDGGIIEPRHLELPDEVTKPVDNTGFYHQQINHLRRKMIRQALRAAEGNRAEAARQLGLSRQALSYLTRELKIG